MTNGPLQATTTLTRPPETAARDPNDFDVAIIGAGPTGLTLANLLGLAGVRTVLIERNASTVAAPRAVSIDDESLRTMQACSLIDAVLADVALDYGAHYFTPKGVCFAKVEPTSREFGYPRRSAFSQPLLEATLRNGLSRLPSVTALFSTTCLAIEECADRVSLTLDPARIVTARYLVGSDGARSMVRKHIGATLVGSTYEQRWLIVDLGATAERFRQTRVLCNPDRPAICLPGPHGIRRYEFMLAPGEDEERATDPEFVRELLAASGPDADAPVVRRQVYTFHARICDRWSSNRIFLAGDAAHLTPPFAGQGMNSGVRDAHNLAWKLAAVTKGEMGAGLLGSYESERAPHAWALIQLAINIGRVMMPASHIQAALIQSAFRLAAIVPPVAAYFAQMKYKPKPYYHEGLLLPDTHPAVGRMLPQPLLELPDGSRRLLDDLIGNEFAIVAYGPEAQAALDWARDAKFDLQRFSRVAVVPMRLNWDRNRDDTGIIVGRDVEDRLAPVAHGARSDVLFVLRPDRYVAAAAAVDGPGDVNRLSADVRALVARTFNGDVARPGAAARVAASIKAAG